MFRSDRDPRSRSYATRPLLRVDPCGRWRGRLAAYIVREHRRGRPLTEILHDRFVVEHASDTAIKRLLENPNLIHRLGDDCR